MVVCSIADHIPSGGDGDKRRPTGWRRSKGRPCRFLTPFGRPDQSGLRQQ